MHAHGPCQSDPQGRLNVGPTFTERKARIDLGAARSARSKRRAAGPRRYCRRVCGLHVAGPGTAGCSKATLRGRISAVAPGCNGASVRGPAPTWALHGGAAMNRHAEQVGCSAGAVQQHLQAAGHAACFRKRRARSLRSRWPDVQKAGRSDRSGRCQISSSGTPSRGTAEKIQSRVRISRRRTRDRWVLDGRASG